MLRIIIQNDEQFGNFARSAEQIRIDRPNWPLKRGEPAAKLWRFSGKTFRRRHWTTIRLVDTRKRFVHIWMRRPRHFHRCSLAHKLTFITGNFILNQFAKQRSDSSVDRIVRNPARNKNWAKRDQLSLDNRICESEICLDAIRIQNKTKISFRRLQNNVQRCLNVRGENSSKIEMDAKGDCFRLPLHTFQNVSPALEVRRNRSSLSEEAFSSAYPMA